MSDPVEKLSAGQKQLRGHETRAVKAGFCSDKCPRGEKCSRITVHFQCSLRVTIKNKKVYSTSEKT